MAEVVSPVPGRSPNVFVNIRNKSVKQAVARDLVNWVHLSKKWSAVYKMILLIRKSLVSTVFERNFQFFNASRGRIHDHQFSGRGIVSWSWPVQSMHCSCGTLTQENQRIIRKLVWNHSSRYNLLKSQASSISSSSVATSLAVQGNSTTTVAANNAGQWDIFAGIVVERKPVITAKKDSLQEKYSKFLAQLEFENSKKSDHEARHDNDKKLLEKAKTGDVDLGNVQTARDEEDKWNAEAQKFKPADRKTEADRKNDERSLERALDSHLLLVVEQKLGKEFRWICPHAKLEEGETLRQAAERMLRTTFPEMRTKVLGHAPWGFYKYKYPRGSTSSIGAKVFFYKAQVVAGEVTKGNGAEIINDFVWLKRNELPNKLQPEYWKKLSECLIDD